MRSRVWLWRSSKINKRIFNLIPSFVGQRVSSAKSNHVFHPFDSPQFNPSWPGVCCSTGPNINAMARLLCCSGPEQAQYRDAGAWRVEGLRESESGKGVTCHSLTHYITTYIFSHKLTARSSFAEDLGLDSLDAVEVVMAVEEVSLSPRNKRAFYMTTLRFDRSFQSKFRMLRQTKSKPCNKVCTPCLHFKDISQTVFSQLLIILRRHQKVSIIISP